MTWHFIPVLKKSWSLRILSEIATFSNTPTAISNFWKVKLLEYIDLEVTHNTLQTRLIWIWLSYFHKCFSTYINSQHWRLINTQYTQYYSSYCQNTSLIWLNHPITKTQHLIKQIFFLFFIVRVEMILTSQHFSLTNILAYVLTVLNVFGLCTYYIQIDISKKWSSISFTYKNIKEVEFYLVFL